MSVLRSLEREKDISVDLVVKAIEDALLIAYRRQEGPDTNARVELDRATGHVTVWAEERDEEGRLIREYDATPSGFGRIAASTAKQVILQRLRDAEDEITLGEFAGRESQIVSGVVQQGKDPRNLLDDLGRVEAILPPQDHVPTETYTHGERLRAWCRRSAGGTAALDHPRRAPIPLGAQALRARGLPEIADGTVEIAAIARKRATAPRWRSSPTSPASTRRARASDRLAAVSAMMNEAAWGEDRHCRLLGRPGAVRRERPVAGPGDARGSA